MIARRLLPLFVLAVSTAQAQINLSGNWLAQQHEDSQERGDGPYPVDYVGIPLNDEARKRALAYSASILSMPERQCMYYAPSYIVLGPQSLQIWPTMDMVNGTPVSWNISGAVDRAPITIWMDGRAGPGPRGLHSFSGHTTGQWQGDTLKAVTTHMKEGVLRRNGVPSSDQASITWYISRYDDILTITAHIVDPVYLTEPQVLSRNWRYNPRAYSLAASALCIPSVETSGPELAGGAIIPHYLPGQNPFVNEVSEKLGVPLEAVLGGAATRLPEFGARLKDTYVRPAECKLYCDNK